MIQAIGRFPVQHYVPLLGYTLNVVPVADNSVLAAPIVAINPVENHPVIAVQASDDCSPLHIEPTVLSQDPVDVLAENGITPAAGGRQIRLASYT